MLMVDDRAGSKELIPLLPPDICRKQRLDAGDVAFFGWGPEGKMTWPIGIEYKTAQDALGSMLTKRFVGEQFPKMSDMYKRIYLLIEGEYSESPTGILQFRSWKSGKPGWDSYTKVSYRSFDNWLNSLTETAKVIVKRSTTRMESAAQVMNLYCLWTKDYEQHKSLFAFDASQTPPQIARPSLLRLMAAQIPGVGWQRSAAVATHFQTPQQMCMATEDQWLQVKGIGKILASRIVKQLSTPSHS